MFPNKDDRVRLHARSSVGKSREMKEYSFVTKHENLKVKMQRRWQLTKVIKENETIKSSPYKKR